MDITPHMSLQHGTILQRNRSINFGFFDLTQFLQRIQGRLGFWHIAPSLNPMWDSVVASDLPNLIHHRAANRHTNGYPVEVFGTPQYTYQLQHLGSHTSCQRLGILAVVIDHPQIAVHLVDIDDQIAYPMDVCLSFEEGKWKMEELLDHQAILRNQFALVEVDSIVGNVKDEGVSTVKYFGAFVMHLL